MKTRSRYAALVFGVGLPLGLALTLGAGIVGAEAEDLNYSMPHMVHGHRAPTLTQAVGDLTSLGHASEITSTQAFTAYVPAIYRNYESPYLEKIYTTPDYLQTDPAYGGLPGGGRTYCGPVAVSNSLIWLDDNGYDNLAPSTSDRKRDQFDVIYRLGSSDYMNTSLENGTGVNSVLKGVDKFVRNKGYAYVRLQYQGWRYHRPRFSTGVDVPDLEWIKQGVRGRSSAWLNYGRYTYDARSDEYTRTGGHWVTIVGYGSEGGLDSPPYFIVHDPGRGDGTSISNLYLLLEQIDSGTLVGDYRGLPHSAAGFHKLTISTDIGSSNKESDVHAASEDAGFRILDGVVVLEMPRSGVSAEASLSMPRLEGAQMNEGN